MFASSFVWLRRCATVASAVCLAVGGLVVGAAVLLPATPVSASVPCGTNGVFSVAPGTPEVGSCTYTTLGADTFTVPPNDGITSIHVVATGAGGGGGDSGATGPNVPDNGGSGARVTADIPATAGDVESVFVGQGGQVAAGCCYGAGGGASSQVAAGTANQVIAGGGGGGGADAAGGNYGSAGASADCATGGGQPGSAGTGGAAGNCAAGGVGGGSGDGGAGGNARSCCPVTVVGAGGAGNGAGAGGDGGSFSGGGGGGYGGGGGGGGNSEGTGGGGGGSTGPAGYSVASAGNGGPGGAYQQQVPGSPGGDGEVVISWDFPLPPTNINPPTISGTGNPGNTLTCNTSGSDWTGSPGEFRYEFLDGATVLQGPSQTQTTYVLGDSDAGTTVTCAVSASNNGGPSNFITSSNSIAVTQPLTITAPSPTINYGDADPVLTPGYSGLINNDTAPSTPPTCSTSPSSPTQVGQYTVTCSGAVDPHYSFTYQTGTLTIQAVDLTITAPSPTINYGAPLPSFAPQYSGLAGGDATTTTPPTCAPTPAVPKNAGSYPVTCSGAVDGNYNISYVAGTLKILPVPLMITAPSATVLDGQAPSLTPHYNGFVAGESASSLTTQPTCTTTYNSAAFPLPLPGPYPVSCSGAVDGNYVISYASGTFTVFLHALPGAVDLAGPDGGVFVLGNPGGFHGSLPGLGIHVNDIVGIAATPDVKGYLLAGRDGGVFAFGDAPYLGSLPGLGLHVSDVAGIVPTPDNKGYYLVGKDGGVFTFGDAVYRGSLPGLGRSVHDVVGIALTNDGGGYWLAEASGAVEHFGDAANFGNAPGGGIVSITATQNGSGYWLTSAIGGIFTYGNAPFAGSLPGLGITVGNIVTTVASPNGGGYLIVGGDGATYAFPNEVFPGSLAGKGLTFVGAAPSG